MSEPAVPAQSPRSPPPPDGAAPGERPVSPGPAARPARSPQETRRLRLRVATGVALVAAALFLWWLHARRFEDTDDAQVDGDITAVSPRVAGTVVATHVTDNQAVNAGDLLLELDPTDLEVALAQARAAVALAEAEVQAESPGVAITQTTNRASVDTAESDIDNARADLIAAQRDVDQAQASNRLAQLNLERARQLLASKTISQADFDQRASAADVAAAALAAAKQRIDQRRAKLSSASTRLRETQSNAPRSLVAKEAAVQVRQANLQAARAQLRQAELNLSYGKLLAPVAGIVGKKSVTVGDRVQPGQQLLLISQTGRLWVTANFRETQIDRMRPGQPATIHVDAVDRDYRGTVESFAGATGSRTSLLPPENASGNYVKVVQRLAVRLALEPGQPGLDRLRPGMSAEPRVRIR